MDIEDYLKSMGSGSSENVKEKMFQLEKVEFKEEGQEKLENMRSVTNSVEKPAKNLWFNVKGEQNLLNYYI
jgi:hypothetical protein